MTYAVKECFLTLQGEGVNAGCAAVFLRFAGCNLWSGREADRGKGAGGCSHWCDTDFVGTDGDGGGRFADAASLARHVAERWHTRSERMVVVTGGEPLLQLDDSLLAHLHAERFSVAVETNGTIPVPDGIDWLTVSPKAGAPLMVAAGDELKLVYPQDGLGPESFTGLAFRHFVLQPMDGLLRRQNTERAARYCMEHPRWRLGVQMHKVVGLR
jgi:7-carboxy-7-deazaguanine synthase (Cx14CxxC type)